MVEPHLNNVADEIWQDLVLFDLLPVIANFLHHGRLLMLQSLRFGSHDLTEETRRVSLRCATVYATDIP